jgi:putative transposase
MKNDTWTIYRRKLPHWRLGGSTYFVTWRLAKSQSALNPEERTLVVNAIQHFVGERYALLAYVVMDDHVHILVEPWEPFSLQKIVHALKSFSANRLQKDFGRIGAIWQREYYDRIVRDEAELEEKAEYILGNPARRWPALEKYQWSGYGSFG